MDNRTEIQQQYQDQYLHSNQRQSIKATESLSALIISLSLLGHATWVLTAELHSENRLIKVILKTVSYLASVVRTLVRT